MPSNAIIHHVFHTKHDFSPELGWAAFQLLAAMGDGVTEPDLSEVAHLVASPLTVRSNLTKLLGGLYDVGLTERNGEKTTLSSVACALINGHGIHADAFYKTVHCLYAWRWLWSGDSQVATPSWSYRQACRHLLAAGSLGIDRDDLTLRVISAAQHFQADKVSFSRSSVSGIVMWLEVQHPPLVVHHSNRIATAEQTIPTIGSLKLHLAALCRLHCGEAHLDSEGMQLLAEALLTSPGNLSLHLNDLCEGSEEFLAINGSVPRIIFRQTDDPLLRWIATGII